jgi:ribonuclease P protein component
MLSRPGEPFRAGIAVSRKVAPAVGRNRVKRVLREFFRLHLDHMPQGLSTVVVAKRHVEPKQLTLAQVEEELLPLYHKWRPPTPANDAPAATHTRTK